jgi:uncharacterized protein (TIGR03083 family)
MIREAYASAARLFTDLVRQVRGDQWMQFGLDMWTVRDLVGHTTRSFITVETYLRSPARDVKLERPEDYYLAQGTQALLADLAALMERGRQAGEALGQDPLRAVLDTAERVLELVRKTPDDTVLGTPAGGMRLIDYLPSRVFELTVHSLDLGQALSVPVALPESAGSLSLHLMADIALRQGKGSALLMAATGRGPLPSGYTLV